MMKQWKQCCGRLVIISLVSFAPALAADQSEPLDLSLAEASPYRTTFEFSDDRLGGFERKKMTKDLRVRGWELSDNIYFGQAKVGKKWGLGFVYENGDTIYGLNHRGIQVMKRF